MKNEYIVERIEDFEFGKYYAVAFNGKIIDHFLCANIDRAASHYLNYTARGCEIVRFLSADEARKIIDNLQYKKSEYFDLFSHSKKGNKYQLDKMCELSAAMEQLKTLFIKSA